MYEELFGFQQDFDEMFNRILTGKPWAGWAQLPEFKKEFNFTPAVEAYVDKEGKKYVCRVTHRGRGAEGCKVHAQGNLLTIHEAGNSRFHATSRKSSSWSRRLLTACSKGHSRCQRAW